MLAYRVRYLVGVMNYFLYVSVYYYLMKAVRAANPEALPGFHSDADIVTYFSVAWAARAAYFNDLDWKIGEQVRTGALVMDLVRPAAFPWMKYAETAGEVTFRLIFMSAPVMLVLAAVYYPDMRPPASLAAVVMFLVSLGLAFHLYYAINFLTGLIAIFTLRIQGFMWAKFLLVQLLSGVMIPLSMFPAWALPVLERTPFAALGWTPVRLYMGMLSGPAAAEALAWQVGWTMLLLAACHGCWRMAERRISIQGG